MKLGTLKFKDKWSMLELYNICGEYLNNQTEEGALEFLHRVRAYTDEYCETKEAII